VFVCGARVSRAHVWNELKLRNNSFHIIRYVLNKLNNIHENVLV
jgi:hypothetical protein